MWYKIATLNNIANLNKLALHEFNITPNINNYGYLVSPEGKVISVQSCFMHDAAAYKYMKENKMFDVDPHDDYNVAEDIIDKGFLYTATAGSSDRGFKGTLFVQFRRKLTDEQYRFIER